MGSPRLARERRREASVWGDPRSPAQLARSSRPPSERSHQTAQAWMLLVRPAQHSLVRDGLVPPPRLPAEPTSRPREDGRLGGPRCAISLEIDGA